MYIKNNDLVIIFILVRNAKRAVSTHSSTYNLSLERVVGSLQAASAKASMLDPIHSS